MLKKILSFTVAMMMIFGCMSVVVSAQSDVITDIEPNDDPETAQAIDTNVTVEGVIAAPDLEAEEPYMDIDVFKFTAVHLGATEARLCQSESAEAAFCHIGIGKRCSREVCVRYIRT